jgi:hypothetical protein
VTTAGAAQYSCISMFAGTGAPFLAEDLLPPLETSLYQPVDISFGPDETPYIVDWNNHRLRAIENGVCKVIMSGGEDLGDATGNDPLLIKVNHPTHIAFTNDGKLLISAWHNSKVLLLDRPANWVESIAGTGARAFAGDGGPAVTSKLDLPVATVMDAAGNIFVLDSANQRIRKIDAVTKVITTVVGTGEKGYGGDGGDGLLAKINLPRGQMGDPAARMAMAPNGRIYIADSGNHRIREWDPATGIITTVAGIGVRGGGEASGDGGLATAANLDTPSDVAFDADGNMYIADTGNHCIRRVDAATQIITTFAGQNDQRSAANNPEGNGGPPTAAKMRSPYGVEVDADGNVYIADTLNNCIRVVRK